MKKIITAALLSGILANVTAQVKMPAPSPTQTIKQDFALGNIELTYSRPSIKGRKIFGDLVPYNKLWRTGANAATILKLSDPLEIGGKKVDSGSYALYTVPGEDNWEIILNKGIKNWGVDGYKESEDVVRFRVPIMKVKPSVESFSMQFTNIQPETCELHIMWDKTSVAIPLKAIIKDRMRAQIEKGMATDKKPYWSATQYYFEYEKNNAKALENAKGAVADNPKAYWMWIYKARIEKEMGKKDDAMASSQKSLELAREAKNDDYVKINEDFQKKLK